MRVSGVICTWGRFSHNFSFYSKILHKRVIVVCSNNRIILPPINKLIVPMARTKKVARGEDPNDPGSSTDSSSDSSDDDDDSTSAENEPEGNSDDDADDEANYGEAAADENKDDDAGNPTDDDDDDSPPSLQNSADSPPSFQNEFQPSKLSFLLLWRPYCFHVQYVDKEIVR